MSSADVQREFDVVIFGATGFTGQFVVEEIARVVQKEHGIKWAIAGRNKSKLETVLKQASEVVGNDVTGTSIIIADVADEESLLSMCRLTRMILNCVGPYRFFGEPVVKACVEAGSHHLDISGEPQFIETMQLKYHDAAQKAGCYIISTCGFDSIPADLGVIFTRDVFKGDLNSIEAYLSINTGPEGGSWNYGTYQTAIHSVPHTRDELLFGKKLVSYEVPPPAHKATKRPQLFRGERVGSDWCVHFQGADRSVVQRTQRFNYEQLKERPVQFNPFVRISSTFWLVIIALMTTIFSLLANFSFGRSLLEKYPKIFTLGYFSHEGPTKKQIEGSSFSWHFVGEGYETKIADPDQQHDDKPSKMIETRVCGPEPGYVTTPICLVAAAMTVLKEAEKMPLDGGVLTPGGAFRKTSLRDRLTEAGMKFEKL
ncbi:PREDICTED: saccharopine dehydrogenase-like oxidoreductase isoform X2 [Priapulus caudatus]|uniref:Saccharopine dehydrogenase-like oxidoreductase isoform X2 n=1 Tax=Priapulus caudatus TaxID=37621 RepID=A0ABM1E6T3_PRICU|nr:PREDICTED: saccharopine dehydrogenase-like oxidoreductase isoform X2 [Priapulus caudatus]